MRGRLPDQDVLQNREVRDEPDVLEAPRHPAAHPQAGRYAGDVLPVDLDPPGRDRIHAADQVEDGGLARAVGTDQGCALAAHHAERQIPDDLQPAEGLGHPVQAQDGGVSHGGRPLSSPMRCAARSRGCRTGASATGSSPVVAHALRRSFTGMQDRRVSHGVVPCRRPCVAPFVHGDAEPARQPWDRPASAPPPKRRLTVRISPAVTSPWGRRIIVAMIRTAKIA